MKVTNLMRCSFFREEKKDQLISIVTGKTTLMVLEISTVNFG